jgi:hypothetical protein
MESKGGEQTWTMDNNSFVSRASNFLISNSMFFAWFFDADDCNLRFNDIIAAVCDTAVADSC